MRLELFVSTITRLVSLSPHPLIEILVPKRERERKCIDVDRRRLNFLRDEPRFTRCLIGTRANNLRKGATLSVETCNFCNFYFIYDQANDDYSFTRHGYSKRRINLDTRLLSKFEQFDDGN